MQLTIEVLPAPLGPIMENSSPALTPKLTSVSALTPPKRSETPRTSKAYSTHSLRNAYSATVVTCFAIGIHAIKLGRFARSRVWQRSRSTRFIATGQPVSTGSARQRLLLPQARKPPGPIDFGIRERFRAKHALGLAAFAKASAAE